MIISAGGVGFYVAYIYLDAKRITLDEEVLTSPSATISIFDSKNKPIEQTNEVSRPYAKIQTLSEDTLNAFISIEDKSFYKHHGVNYKRIAKAMLNNLKSGRLKEGASTITQQLIKNTYLSSEKTYKRKIQEIALAQTIEKRFSKEEILEFYLNAIYFGNNCYGIESASNFYFSKPANDLSINEASLLAGIIKSPTKYCPIKHKENALARRNLVLSEMNKDKKLSDSDLASLSTKEISLNIQTERENALNSYSQAGIDEAEEILGIPAQQIALQGYKIYTYLDEERQDALQNSFKAQNLTCDSCGIIINNQTHGVEGFAGHSPYKILSSKRSPGSCLKPILVFSPALNEDIISPCTQILDEKTIIGDYAPKNVGEKYRGYVSARESLSKSINIPAVKILSYVGIEKAKSYAQSMGIEFDEKDDSFALALGGMTYGVSPLNLGEAYSVFANQGKYAPAKFVKFITDKKDKIVYIHKPEEKSVIRDDCAYLLTDMLRTCAKTGTAKRLSSLNIDIASKTGTVGKSGSKENLDAWNCAYTKNYTAVAWLGNLDNTPISYAGGNQPTQILKDYFEQVGDSSTFEVPESITTKRIDCLTLKDEHIVSLANDYIPEKYTQEELFSKFNLPKTISQNFIKLNKEKFSARADNGVATISFEGRDYLTYEFSSNGKIVAKEGGKKGNIQIKVPLSQDNQTINVKYFYTCSPEIQEKEEIKFQKSNKKSNKKWFI